jgi:threonine dehydratase
VTVVPEAGLSRTAWPVEAHDVLTAVARLRDVGVRTPLLASEEVDRIVGHRVLVKAETSQRTGSFKFRGAYNAMAALSEDQRERGVIGASSGNHALALALSGKLLGASVTVVVPDDAPVAKAERIRALRARILTYDHRDPLGRDAIVHETARRHHLTVVPSASHPKVVAGAGTTAYEMFEDVPDLSAILVPVGGGGLAAGTALVARSVRPAAKVYGVEPVQAADTHFSVRAGRVLSIPPPRTVADGLRHTRPPALTFEINRRLLADVITVAESEIANAMACLWREYRIVAEPSGAVAFAGLLKSGRRLPDGSVGVIVSGGNVDWPVYRMLVDIATDRDARRRHADRLLH